MTPRKVGCVSLLEEVIRGRTVSENSVALIPERLVC